MLTDNYYHPLMINRLLKIFPAFLLSFLIPIKDFTIEESGRRKLFVYFLSILFIPLIPFIAFHIAEGNLHFGVINSLVASFLLSMIVIQRKMKHGGCLYRLTMCIINFLLIFWIYSGAIEGYSSLFALSFTPFALFLMGKKEGMLWTLSLFSIALIIMVNPFNIDLPYAYSVKFAVRYLMTFIFIILFSYNYESVRHKYQTTIMEEQNSLKQTVEQLDIENRMKTGVQAELEKHKLQLEELIAERTTELQLKNDELRKSQNELLSGEKRYRLLADNITDLIWATDINLKYIYFSPSVEKMFGYSVEEALNIPVDKWSTSESHKKIASAYIENIELDRAGEIPCDHYIVLEVDQIKKDKTIFPVELKISFIKDENKKTIGIVGITRDLTERRRVEKEKDVIQSQLLQAQKMEAVGILASGLAHDFNNLLSGIIGSFNLIEMFIDDESPNREKILNYINIGLESSGRSSQIIKQLMTLSKKSELTLLTLDINESLRHIFDICKNSFPKSVILDFRIDKQSLFVMADPVQIEQVLLNLCINASHAMTIMRADNEPEGGTLTVSTTVIENTEIKNILPPDSAEFEKWLRVDVADNGVGMNGEIQQKLFAPFFSTKKQNEGTGLGLATSYNIIKQHKGFITVESEPGEGSLFSLFIPCRELNHDYKSEKQENVSLIRGAGTILIIDDEKAILKVAEGILNQCGYETITSETPDAGIDVFREKFKTISAVLLDLSMPGKSGIEVFHELLRINSDVKVLLSSGMIDIEAKQKAFEIGIKGVINKPYIAYELSAEIEKVIYS